MQEGKVEFEDILVNSASNLRKVLEDTLSVKLTCPRCQEFTKISELSLEGITIECPVCFFEMSLTRN